MLQMQNNDEPLRDDLLVTVSRCSRPLFTARRNARIASAVLATAIPSVRPSVRHTPVLCQNDGT